MTQTAQSINVKVTPVSAAELLGNARPHIRPYDEVFANAKAIVMHGLVQMLLLAKRDEETGRVIPLDEWDRKHLEAVTMRALNMADVDVLTDVASDSTGQTATECWSEQIVDPRVIARRAISDFLEQIAEAR